MKDQINHIIGRQSVEISFDNLDDALGVQDRIAELFYERIQPRMESLFDEIFDKTCVICFERIEVDSDMLPVKNWEDEWVESVLRKLKEQLSQADKKERAVADPGHEFLFYLQQGYLPWNSRINSVQELEDDLIMDNTLMSALRELVNEYPSSAKRLASKFSIGFINKLIEKLSALRGIANAVIAELIEELNLEVKDQLLFREAIIIALSGTTESRMELKEKILEKMSQQPQSPQKPSVDKKEPKPFANNKEEGIYINNAGLIIFHPFLPQFFEQLNFTKDGKWVDEKLQHKAAMVLGYLVSGINEIKEFDLPLPKIIVGINPQTVITEGGIFENDIIDACNELITEIIGHWVVLKNTGIESFRHTFLQRKGKLSTVDNGWLLQVERQGVDLLLASLPWGIGVARLPWMKEIIFTEWA